MVKRFPSNNHKHAREKKEQIFFFVNVIWDKFFFKLSTNFNADRGKKKFKNFVQVLSTED